MSIAHWFRSVNLLRVEPGYWTGNHLDVQPAVQATHPYCVSIDEERPMLGGSRRYGRSRKRCGLPPVILSVCSQPA